TIPATSSELPNISSFIISVPLSALASAITQPRTAPSHPEMRVTHHNNNNERSADRPPPSPHPHSQYYRQHYSLFRKTHRHAALTCSTRSPSSSSAASATSSRSPTAPCHPLLPQPTACHRHAILTHVLHALHVVLLLVFVAAPQSLAAGGIVVLEELRRSNRAGVRVAVLALQLVQHERAGGSYSSGFIFFFPRKTADASRGPPTASRHVP
ncbi:hypothetical protein TcCL_NonESM12709, partial [Trypanosoma cruzi]